MCGRHLACIVPRLWLSSITRPLHPIFLSCSRKIQINQGNSLRALVELGKRKGYELIATTSLNAFFVREDLFPLVGVSDNSVETLFADRSSLMDAFQLYDGTLVFTGKRKLFWHGIV